MTDTPAMTECERMVKVAPDSQKIGEFLDWLGEQGVALCRPTDDEWWPDHVSIERRLAAYFDIDLHKVEAERSALLAHIRAQA